MKSENQAIVVEWAPFEMAAHVSETQLTEAAEVLERDFLSRQKGYVRRELLKGKGSQWVDLVYWSSPEDAALAAKAANESEVCYRYFSLMAGVENAEQGVSHFTRVKSWN